MRRTGNSSAVGEEVPKQFRVQTQQIDLKKQAMKVISLLKKLGFKLKDAAGGGENAPFFRECFKLAKECEAFLDPRDDALFQKTARLFREGLDRLAMFSLALEMFLQPRNTESAPPFCADTHLHLIELFLTHAKANGAPHEVFRPALHGLVDDIFLHPANNAPPPPRPDEPERPGHPESGPYRLRLSDKTIPIDSHSIDCYAPYVRPSPPLSFPPVSSNGSGSGLPLNSLGGHKSSTLVDPPHPQLMINLFESLIEDREPGAPLEPEPEPGVGPEASGQCMDRLNTLRPMRAECAPRLQFESEMRDSYTQVCGKDNEGGCG